MIDLIWPKATETTIESKVVSIMSIEDHNPRAYAITSNSLPRPGPDVRFNRLVAQHTIRKEYRRWYQRLFKPTTTYVRIYDPMEISEND